MFNFIASVNARLLMSGNVCPALKHLPPFLLMDTDEVAVGIAASGDSPAQIWTHPVCQTDNIYSKSPILILIPYFLPARHSDEFS